MIMATFWQLAMIIFLSQDLCSNFLRDLRVATYLKHNEILRNVTRKKSQISGEHNIYINKYFFNLKNSEHIQFNSERILILEKKSRLLWENNRIVCVMCPQISMIIPLPSVIETVTQTQQRDNNQSSRQSQIMRVRDKILSWFAVSWDQNKSVVWLLWSGPGHGKLGDTFCWPLIGWVEAILSSYWLMTPSDCYGIRYQ